MGNFVDGSAFSAGRLAVEEDINKVAASISTVTPSGENALLSLHSSCHSTVITSSLLVVFGSSRRHTRRASKRRFCSTAMLQCDGRVSCILLRHRYNSIVFPRGRLYCQPLDYLAKHIRFQYINGQRSLPQSHHVLKSTHHNLLLGTLDYGMLDLVIPLRSKR